MAFCYVETEHLQKLKEGMFPCFCVVLGGFSTSAQWVWCCHACCIVSHSRPSSLPSCLPSPTLGIMQHSAGLSGERNDGRVMCVVEVSYMDGERHRDYIWEWKERLVMLYKPLSPSSSFIHHSHSLTSSTPSLPFYQGHPQGRFSHIFQPLDWLVQHSRALKWQQRWFVLPGQQPSSPQPSSSFGRRDGVWQLLPHTAGFSQDALLPILKYSMRSVKKEFIMSSTFCLSLSTHSKVKVTSCLSVVIDPVLWTSVFIDTTL